MAPFSNKIAFVIPTMDRPQLLHRLLTSIQAQEPRPDQIVVVDGGQTELGSVLDQFPELPLDYVAVRPPALTKQKNVGVRTVDSSLDLIACVDDDIVLEPEALAAMLGFWESADPEVGGASFNLTGAVATTSWINRLFFIDNTQFGVVSNSGYNSPIINAEKTQRSQWLVGGATVWRKDIFQEHSFNEWFLGSGLCEDLDFSYQVGKQRQLYVVAEASVQHLEPARSRRSNYQMGKVQVINQVYFVRRNPELSLTRCGWNLFGRLHANLLKGIVRLDTNRLMRAWGNLSGLAQLITGRTPQVAVSSSMKLTSGELTSGKPASGDEG